MTTSTYILVPGAGGDAFYWHRVVPLLRDAGHEAVAVDLPAGEDGAGLAAYADAIAGAMGDRSDVVLVAQSMGAFSAPLAAARGDVSRIVLVAPMIPAPGETPGEFWGATGQDEASRALAVAEGRDPDAPFDLHEMFLHDVPAEVAERLLAHGEGGDEGASWDDPWPLDAWPDVPTTRDRGRPRPAVPARVHARPRARPARPRRGRRDRLGPPPRAQPPGGPGAPAG